MSTSTFAGLKADFLISNPPYLDSDKDVVDLEVRTQEPASVLFAPKGDPLFFYREIALRGPAVLKRWGLVFLELAHERAQEVKTLFSEAGWAELKLVADLNGRERVMVARWTK